MIGATISTIFSESLDPREFFTELYELNRWDDGKLYWNYFPSIHIFPSYNEAQDYIAGCGYIHLKRLEGRYDKSKYILYYDESDLE